MGTSKTQCYPLFVSNIIFKAIRNIFIIAHNVMKYNLLIELYIFEVHQKKNNPIVQLAYLERNKNRLSNEQLKYILTFLGQMLIQCNETI